MSRSSDVLVATNDRAPTTSASGPARPGTGAGPAPTARPARADRDCQRPQCPMQATARRPPTGNVDAAHGGAPDASPEHAPPRSPDEDRADCWPFAPFAERPSVRLGNDRSVGEQPVGRCIDDEVVVGVLGLAGLEPAGDEHIGRRVGQDRRGDHQGDEVEQLVAERPGRPRGSAGRRPPTRSPSARTRRRPAAPCGRACCAAGRCRARSGRATNRARTAKT